ncbi:pullulanase [Peribacillus deserti]|uniref:pullulanase n=1 Tax=Peribacillus deserti TaxID=673318 RepID=A0ABS2QMG2_9BACI|nr:type I pullulanase [Peribacillus deserti]MBM7694150.1 pullulanase [Peribacillus deserti]
MKKKTVFLVFVAAILLVSSLVSAFFLKTIAQAEGATKVTIHYRPAPDDTKNWNLWIWPEGKDGKAYPFTDEDGFGKTAEVILDGSYSKVGFIVRTDSWEKDGGDRFIDIKNAAGEVWVVSGDDRVYTEQPEIDQTPKITSAVIDELNSITFQTNIPFNITEQPNGGIQLSGAHIKEVKPLIDGKTVTNQVKVVTSDPLNLSGQYTISKEGYGETTVGIGKVVRTKEFDDLYYYRGRDLGNTYEKDKTSFRVWAPTARELKLVTYTSWDDKEGTEIPMKKDIKGTWVTEIKGNQQGLIYTYKVLIADRWNEAVDPYVRAVTVNGDKGVVMDLTKTDPKKWTQKKKRFTNPEDAVIYELHVRDLSIQKESGIKNKGKYLGAAEAGTRGPGGFKTGLDYMKELGVTHVQFLPLYDYRTVDETELEEPQFNWGYDPKNYNAPEGSYATDPYDPAARIRELKQMVQALHENDLNVIMDVVYNHVYDMNEHSFNKLVPGYFFRYNENGTPANGTGVGNDIASERKMAQKFIVESVSYWAKEYHLDGFRFDLMGILDVETMNKVRKELDKIDPSIIVLGEGWDMGTPLPPDQKANQKNAEKMDGIAHFNDSIRDSLKGSVFSDQDKGFINGKPNTENIIKQGIEAGINYPKATASYTDPGQTVTYVEAHDNLTLWDKLQLTNPEASLKDQIQMHKLASSIMLTSQGVSFIHAGQEFMRTKQGDHNSYKSPDSINQLDWNRRAEFDEQVQYIEGLIELRKKFSSFRMDTADKIKDNLTFIDSPVQTVAFTLNAKANHDAANEIAVIHNAGTKDTEITLPSNAVWKVLVDGDSAGTKILNKFKGSRITVTAKSTYVLIR